jgi:hypothetical protein
MTKQRVVEIAHAAAIAHKRGETHVKINGTTFRVGPVYGSNGKPKGYCARFIRQVHECALGLRAYEWPYRAAHAKQMESNLKRAGLAVEKPQPGDIVCINNDAGKYGHIAILLAGGYIAENTSSSRRGIPKEPGTKITKFSNSLRARVTGYYATMPEDADEGQTVLVIEHGTDNVLDTLDVVPGGNHIEDQGKLYVKT